MRWNIVEAASRPGVTTTQPAHRQPRTLDGTVHLHRLQRVRRTCGVVAAHVAVQRTDGKAVQPQQCHEDVLHALAPERLSARSSCSARVWLLASPAGGSARTTTREPSGTASRRSRIRWRRRRLTRLRSTADPTALLTTNPTDVRSPAPATTWVTRVGWAARRPRRTACRNCALSRIRCSGPNMTGSSTLRLRAWRGPCGGGRPGSRGRHACACADGSHASWRDDGCSADRCACSR